MNALDKNYEILQLRQDGQTLAAVAKRFGLSRQRIHQIVTSRIVPQSKLCDACGSVFVSKQARRKTCSYHCWLSIHPRKPRQARQQGTKYYKKTCPGCASTFTTINYRRKYCVLEHRISYKKQTAKTMTPREAIFSMHRPDLIYLNQSSRLFKLNGYCYTPDFRNTEGTVFYEVVGTRQAYHANKHKYDEFRSLYPSLRLIIVRPNGAEIDFSLKPRWRLPSS